MLQVTLEGMALHAGLRVSVALRRAPGALSIVQRGRAARLADMRVANAERGVVLVGDDGRVSLQLCEHLLAAFSGLGVHEGVEVATDDPELPLLDGGAAAFASALRAIDAPTGARGRLVVARSAALRHGAAEYRFEPASDLRVDVAVEFPPPVGAERAAWDGDPEDFRARIAPARTFGWASEHAALLARGLARGADQEGVLVFDERGALPGRPPQLPGECARHKLLDLLGDLMVHGGLGRGRLSAHRPGHAATHEVVAEALRAGILESSAGGRDSEGRRP